MNQLKQNLRAGHSVTRAMYDAGYGSSSRLYERTASQMGMTPDKYRRGAVATQVRYTITKSPLGPHADRRHRQRNLRHSIRRHRRRTGAGSEARISFRLRRRDDVWLKNWKEQLLSQLRGKEVHAALPLGHPGNRFPAACMDLFAIDPQRRNSLLSAGRKIHRTTNRRSCRGSRLRYESGGARDSLSSHRA